MKTCRRTIQVFVISATMEQTGIIIKDSANASKKVTSGERSRDIRMGHWEDTGADNRHGQVFCQGEDTGEIQRDIGRCEAPGAGWHQGSPHITSDIPEHTHCYTKIQLHQRARHEQPLPFSTSLHFHKIAGKCCKSHIYSIFCLPRESTEKAAPQQTRTRLTTVELKLHRTVGSVQKYPACGMLDSQQEGPQNTPAGICASSWGSPGAKVPGTAASPARQSTEVPRNTAHTHGIWCASLLHSTQRDMNQFFLT